jgi:hypothetical protein
MPDYTVTFSANLHVEVSAEDEDEARARATLIADAQATRLEGETISEDDVTHYITIHPDDIVRVEEQPPAVPQPVRGTGIGSEGIPGTEYPGRTIYTDDNSLYYVPFIADDGRVGYRIGVAVAADKPGGEWASREAFVYLNPSTSIDAPEPETGDVFVYSGPYNDPNSDTSEVFIPVDPETFGLNDEAPEETAMPTYVEPAHRYALSLMFEDYDFDTPEEAAAYFIKAIRDLADDGEPLYVTARDENGKTTSVKVVPEARS